jgi:hypothetical protein
MTETPQKDRFDPTERTREIFKEIADLAHDEGCARFFELWEEQDSPREAGSVVAASHMRIAAVIAVFGCECEGREPDLETWLKMAAEEFHSAVNTVSGAMRKAATAMPKGIET